MAWVRIDAFKMTIRHDGKAWDGYIEILLGWATYDPWDGEPEEVDGRWLAPKRKIVRIGNQQGACLPVYAARLNEIEVAYHIDDGDIGPWRGRSIKPGDPLSAGRVV